MTTVGLVAFGTGAAAQTAAEAGSATAANAVSLPGEDYIVVTASKIGERLDRAPVAAVTLGGGELARLNVQSVRDAQVRLPSIVYNDSGGSAQVYIRGIGTNSAYAGLESSIGTYQDGVYLQRQVGASVDIVDLQSIEVLNGPQGSLYGRNATGGVILLTTNDPVDALHGNVRATIGNYGRLEGEGMLNLPLTDDLAFRVAGKYSHLGGYIRNIATGDRLGGHDSGTVRGKLRYAPGSGLTVVASVEYHREQSDPIARRLLTGAPLCTACAVFGVTPSPAGEFYQVSQNRTRDTSIRYLAGTLNIAYETDDFNLVSVTGIRDFHYKIFVDQDFSSGDLFNSRAEEFGTTFTQDAYVRTKLGGAFNFLFGVSGEVDKDTLFVQLMGAAFGPLAGAQNDAKVKLRSFSPYGEAYLQLPSDFKLTVGGRYNIDTKKLRATSDAKAVAALGATPAFGESVTFRDFTPRVVLSHETRLSTAYLSYSKGAKSGGYNTPAFAPLVPLRPEKLTSYEAGLKAHSADNGISIAVAGFYYDYKDIQVSFVDASTGSVRAENAAKARIYGMEMSGVLRPIAGLTLSAGGLLEHAKFKDYRRAAIFCPAAFASPGYPGCPAPSGGPGLVSGVADLSGTTLPRAPDLSYSLSADYAFPLGEGWRGTISAADRYTARYDFLPGGGGPLGLSRQPAVHLITASLTLSQEPEGFEVKIFATNIANQKYYLDFPTSAFGVSGSVGAPRSYGLSVGYSF
ncbi:TonB-dependent receptor [Rhizorhabdus argentea]|uniref:TonB-dependent receptor n=1 Tax=Rhizorhabdus argentea TaxID=1387174 RepID=UPI0030EEEB7C